MAPPELLSPRALPICAGVAADTHHMIGAREVHDHYVELAARSFRATRPRSKNGIRCAAPRNQWLGEPFFGQLAFPPEY